MSSRGAEWIDDISREESPERHDDSPEKRASKKRKVLSCYACRNRKMKCDRIYPVCGRCQKTGRVDQCTYDPRLLEESNVNSHTHAEGANAFVVLGETEAVDPAPAPASTDALQWKIRSQERRIEMLEQKLATKERYSNRRRSHYEDSMPEEPDIKEEMMYRGKGFKSQFHGATSVMSTIARYRELQAFTRESLNVDHSIMRVKTDFKTFRDQRKKFAKQHGARTYGTDAEVFAALPERNVADAQVALYFQHWETTYRVMHEPSFWTEYNQFWARSSNDKSQSSFATILVLIVAMTKCLTPKEDAFIGDTTVDRQDASNLIEICDSWINQQPRKRLTLSFFQLQCLSLLAKRVNCVRLKQDWVNSGDLVRLALASGMHRDPSLLASGRITEFEKELKKRLWTTIMELELQSSLESGLPSSLTSLYFDTPAPANLPDDAFSAECQQIPASRPLSDYTSASYLNAALKSLPLRIHLAQLLNTPSSDLQYSDVLHYDAQIQSAIASLPAWDDNGAIIPSALLQIQLRQYLLILHKPYAKLARQNNRYMYSLTTIVDTANSIIGTYDNMATRGTPALNNSRNDVIRVGLTLSSVIYAVCDHQGPIKSSIPDPPGAETQFADPHTHFADLPHLKRWGRPDTPLYLAILPQSSFLMKMLCASGIEMLERTRQIYEQKVMRLGTGFMEYWLMSAAVGMLPSAPSPATSIAYVTHASDDIMSRCRKTLDHFTTLAFRVLALQEDPQHSFASSLRNTMASVSPSDGRTPSINMGALVGPSPVPLGGGHTFTAVSNMDFSSASADTSKDLGGPFDALQDMQVDLGGWSFPDFWAFDLGGDF